jgi:tetratricopeptide (TPR) repeat protein
MSMLDKILGNTPSTGAQIRMPQAPGGGATQPAPAAAAAVSAGEKPIRVYDQFGRKVDIGRESWRRDVLLPSLAANRDKPDVLYDLIAGALREDFAADVLESARHLAAIDPKPQRGALMLAVSLLQLADPAGARDVLERALARNGDDPYLLGNLARAFEALGEHDRALETIWRALRVDPNAGSSLGWLAATVARDGQAAVLAAYARAAMLPGSWRAQLFLARDALENGKDDEATRLYEEVLARAQPVPADLLMHLSGDLGTHGRAEELLRLTLPRFDIATHGLMVGNNLLRAYLDLGMVAEARKLLERLYAQQRPDWREHLEQWERRVDDAQKRYGEVTGPIEVIVYRLDQPVWAHGTLGFDTVLPVKQADSPRIIFVCASGEAAVDESGGKVVAQPTNELGRLTRALPLFLAEECYLRTDAQVSFLLPWMSQGGFILSARPWTREFLGAEINADLLVFMHVDAQATPWRLQLRIEDAAGAEVATLEHPFSLPSAAHDALTLLHAVIARLSAAAAIAREESKPALATPPAELLPGYFAAIEQALAVNLAARAPGGGDFLHQERAIFDHLLDVALHAGDSLRPRMLLVTALENESRRRPDIAREYLEKLALLQQRHPLNVGADVVAKAVAMVSAKAGG